MPKTFAPTREVADELNLYDLQIRDLSQQKAGALKIVLRQAGLTEGDWAWDGSKFTMKETNEVSIPDKP